MGSKFKEFLYVKASQEYVVPIGMTKNEKIVIKNTKKTLILIHRLLHVKLRHQAKVVASYS